MTAARTIAVMIADALSEGTGDESSAALVARVLRTVASERSDALLRAVSARADQSRQALGAAARALRLPEPSTDDEWSSIMRELPRLDPGPLAVNLHLVGLKALGRRIAGARVRAALRAQIGGQIAAALETHGHVLRHWGLRALGRLRQFETQAQTYRAQLSAALTEGLDTVGAEQALRQLEDLHPAEARP